MSKYAPLAAYLQAQQTNSVTLNFHEIDQLVAGLPRSARNHEAWWSNSRTEDSHTWAHLWLAAGWQRGPLDLVRELVVFERAAPHPSTKHHFWWVNHKQTYRVELEGGYIWSPTEKQNGSRNQAYINLTLVQPGDIVVSYADTVIKAIGVATGRSVDAPKPEGYGAAGESWNSTGWRVPIEWTLLEKPLRPKDYLSQIEPLLPDKYSPLQRNGDGNQSTYLASISDDLGRLILMLAGEQSPAAVVRVEALEDQVEEECELVLIETSDISVTEKEQLVRSRRGQGQFRLNVQAVSPRCLLTGVTDQSFLIASHIKPWKDCSNPERLDGYNGLMLAPHVDKLFDRGWISFLDNGELIVAPGAGAVLKAWGIDPCAKVRPFSRKYAAYLQFHRDQIFKR